jgi:hypothetical protein
VTGKLRVEVSLKVETAAIDQFLRCLSEADEALARGNACDGLSSLLRAIRCLRPVHQPEPLPTGFPEFRLPHQHGPQYGDSV